MIASQPVDRLTNKRIFNHRVIGVPFHHSDRAGTLLGNHFYPSRALGLTAPLDIIQLPSCLKTEWEYIHSHYERIGLSHSCNVIWDDSPEVLKAYPEYEISVFFFGEDIHQVVPNQTWFDVATYLNSKNNFCKLAENLGLSIPRTFCFADKSAMSKPDNLPVPCFLKISTSYSGIGIYYCEDLNSLKIALSNFDDDVPFQIQQEIRTNTFINLQYQADAEKLRRLVATQQILNGYAHMGNSFPTIHEPWEAVEPMAIWMYEKGMRGVWAFDVAVLKEDTVKYVLLECNPRYNGSTYPSMIGLKIGVSQWMCEAVQIPAGSLASLDLSGIEFDPQTKTGLILVNWGTVLVGKVSVMFCGPSDRQIETKKELAKRLDAL